MNDDELQQKVNDLRSTLNDGRNHVTHGTSSTSGDTQRDNPSVDSPKRRTSKNLRATDSGTTRGKVTDRSGTRSSDGTERRVEAESNRVGQATNRHEQDNSDVSPTRHDDQGVITRGRLIRDEAEPPKREKSPNPTTIFTAIPHRGPGRPKKQEEAKTDRATIISSLSNRPIASRDAARQFRNPLKLLNAPTLTQQEVSNFIEPLGKAFVDYGGYFDEYIRIKKRDTSLVFFGDLSYDEANVLAKVVLRLGKQNAQVATATRTIVSGNDYLSAIIILWPRISRLIDALGPEPKATTARPPRPAFSLFRKVELKPQGENE